ncbi:MAG: low molecular weight phosphotyrosine protein phosphatase [Gammaproteobacteria bacterium]|nr:low molecular weight phosphotyrosine protein phosphatase [Gammaproteobacteria bacterium]
MTEKPIKTVLFICMGNICRSPAAEAVFLDKIAKRGVVDRFRVDSAGTGGWHAGNPADPRSSQEGARRGYTLTSRARQIRAEDAEDFDLLICMDEANRDDLLQLGMPAEKVRLLLDWHPDAGLHEVPDPYYGGQQGFVRMYDLIETACEKLLDDLTA